MAIDNYKKNKLASDFDNKRNANLDTLIVESLQTTNFPARSESVSRLRFDIEQLRSRWSGLEKEIKAREVLTDQLNRRLSDTQWKLAHAESLQNTKETENAALRSNLKDKLSLLSSVEKEAKKVSETFESGQSLIKELQEKIDEQQTTIKMLNEENNTFVGKKQEALAALADKEKQITKLKTDDSVGDRDSLTPDHTLSKLRQELGNSKQEVEDLRESLHSDRAPERRENGRRINDQDDVLLLNRQEISVLKTQITRTESYADELRTRLQDTEVERKKAISALSRKMNNLERSNKDVERQIENKDNAIAALLNELASRSRTIDSAGESKKIIHEIDGRLSGNSQQKSSTARDPMARLLIGNVEGQELQFPLFKDRLTIGRTAHNDIQLKAHFISRRHALIVTEEGLSRIVDWGSKNGVYVNDSRVSEQILRNGDVVSIGSAEFRYEERLKR
jgi:chromosome segregation ATPase